MSNREITNLSSFKEMMSVLPCPVQSTINTSSNTNRTIPKRSNKSLIRTGTKPLSHRNSNTSANKAIGIKRKLSSNEITITNRSNRTNTIELTSTTTTNNNNADPLMTYEKCILVSFINSHLDCMLLTQKIYLLQNSISSLEKEKDELLKQVESKPYTSINQESNQMSETKLACEIQLYNNITNNCKNNSKELIKEIETLSNSLSKYISPSNLYPSLNYLSEMTTEPYENIVLRMK